MRRSTRNESFSDEDSVLKGAGNPMSNPDSFAELMTQLRQGDNDAAARVFARFTSSLVSLASHRLEPCLRRKIDPEDIVQSVYKSFFRRQHAGQFTLLDWDSLWGLLSVITIRKCLNRSAHFHAECRDVGQEVAPGDIDPTLALLARDPTPEEAAVLAETVEQLISSFDEGEERDIVMLALQGLPTEEISARLGRAERTVRRIRERIRKRLERAVTS
jgi:RNA polymerase sigma-70 factor (ECF subfamily)